MKYKLIATALFAALMTVTFGFSRPLDDKATKAAKKTGDAVEDAGKDTGKAAESAAIQVVLAG